MKKWASLLLAVFLFFAGAPKAFAAELEKTSGNFAPPVVIAAQGIDGDEAPQASEETDEKTPVKAKLYATQTYVVISGIEKSDEITVTLTRDDKPLTAEEFKRVSLEVDCDGIAYKTAPDEKASSYSIKLLQTEGLAEGAYEIRVSAAYTDQNGRVIQSEDSVTVTLGNAPLWLKWMVLILTLLALFLILWQILHINVIPSSKVLHNVNTAALYVEGKKVTSYTLRAKRKGKKLEFRMTYLRNNFSVIISHVRPGRKSYTFLREVRRSFLINPYNITCAGHIDFVEICGRRFEIGENGRIAPDPSIRPVNLRSNTIVSFGGSLEEKGKVKPFHAVIPLSFKTPFEYFKDLLETLRARNDDENLVETLQKLAAGKSVKQPVAPAKQPEAPTASEERKEMSLLEKLTKAPDASEENGDSTTPAKLPEIATPSEEQKAASTAVKKYAFISYSTKNQSYANSMRDLFNKHGIDTWMAPYDIPAGSKYAAVLTRAIRECSCFVLLLSNDSQASEAVDQEVELAVMEFKKSVITVELEKVVLNDAFTFYIHNKQIIAAHQFDENSPELQQVLEAVRTYTKK